MLRHDAGIGIGYTGPGPRMGPIDNFSLVTGPVTAVVHGRRNVSKSGTAKANIILHICYIILPIVSTARDFSLSPSAHVQCM